MSGSAYNKWILTERVLAILAFIVIAAFVVLSIPDRLPASPEEVLKMLRPTQDCTRPGPLRQIDVAQELQKPKPDFTDADLRGADLSGKTFTEVSFVRADLSSAILENTLFDEAYLNCARLWVVRADGARFLNTHLDSAKLNESSFKDANFQNSYLIDTDLSGATLTNADLRDVDFSGAIFGGTSISGSRFGAATISLSDYRPVDAPNAGEAQNLDGIESVRLTKPDLAGLNLLAIAFEDADLGSQAAETRATSARWDRYFAWHKQPPPDLAERAEILTGQLLFGWVSADGSRPLRPIWMLAVLILGFAAVYWLLLLCVSNPYNVIRYKIPGGEDRRIPTGVFKSMPAALIFSIIKALLLALPLVNALDLATKAINVRDPYEALGWVWWLSTFQWFLTILLLSNLVFA